MARHNKDRDSAREPGRSGQPDDVDQPFEVLDQNGNAVTDEGVLIADAAPLERELELAAGSAVVVRAAEPEVLPEITLEPIEVETTRPRTVRITPKRSENSIRIGPDTYNFTVGQACDVPADIVAHLKEKGLA